jgi:Zn-finger nucleic acid-binding protein
MEATTMWQCSVKVRQFEHDKLRPAQDEYREQIEKHKRDDDENLLAKKHYWMKCPKCGMDLIEIDYKNIKVDKCTACEGVWFDTGEIVTLMMMVARKRAKV